MVDNLKLYKRNKTYGITLAELLIASTLIGLVLLTVASLDITARRFFSRTEKGIPALNDLTLAMEYMTKTLETSIGDLNNPAFEHPSASGCSNACNGGCDDSFAIRSDSSSFGGNEDGRPYENFNVFFCYDADDHFIRMMPLGEDISRKVTSFNIAAEAPFGSEISEIVISLSGRDKPFQSADTDNPEVNIESRVYLRGAAAR
jgi:hypothetical protein